MPRKTSAASAPRPAIARFNEAAARCRGKLAAAGRDRRLPPRASMRPRPDAAENLILDASTRLRVPALQ